MMTESVSDSSESSLWKYQGILLAALSSVFFSLCSAVVKTMSYIDPGQLAAYRFASIFVLTLPILIYKGLYPLGTKKQRLYLIVRGLTSASSIYLSFLAFRYLPLGEASVIIFSHPIFVAIMARIFLKERFDVLQSLAIVTTILGLAVICKFPMVLYASPDPQRVRGLVCAFVAVLLGSVGFILLRKVKDTDEAVVLFNLSWSATLSTGAFTAALGRFSAFDCGFDTLLVIGFALCSFFGNYLMTAASRLEQATAIATLRSATDIVFSFVWQIALFRNVPDVYSIVGAVLVSFSIVLIGYQKRISKQTA